MLSQNDIDTLNKMQHIYDEMNKDIVNAFLGELLDNYRAANNSGCFSDETPQTVRTNIVLKITGENIRFVTNQYRKELANTRHFI